jgi:Kef-type K+ transport system membrane component KefB
VVTSGFNPWQLLMQAGGVIVFFLLLMYLVGPLKRRLWRRVNPEGTSGGLSAGYLALLLIVLFSCCIATNKLGVFSIFGAFMMGVALHKETSLVRAWRERFTDFVIVALVPIFFTNTGLHTKIGTLDHAVDWMGLGAVLFMSVLGKLGGCYLGARWTGQPRREAACIGALMNTRALMGLVAINAGRELGLLNDHLFTMFVLMALATTVMVGPLLRRWLPEELRAQVPDSGS